MCKLNYKFITEFLVKCGVALDYIILKGVSNLLSFLFIYMKGQKIRNTSEDKEVQYNTVSNYELNAKS